MASLSWRRREVNYWIDMVALATGAIVFATGLVLLTQFHAGRGTLNNAALGLSRLAWLNIHRLTAIVLLAGGLAHALLHWRIMLTRLSRVWNDHPGRASRADIILYFGFAIDLLAGFSSWLFFPGSAPLWGPILLGPLEHSRHICIDLHNFTGLILLPAIIIHIRRHWHFILPVPVLAWTSRSAAPRTPERE